MRVAPEIFKAYDIRGIVGKSLTEPTVRAIGQALGTLAREQRRDSIAIGRDGRLSGPALSAALADGIRAAGVDVVDIGMVTTPMSYFATYHLGTGCSVMVTGSHNPPDYNGLKMVVAERTLSGADIQDLRQRIERDDVATGAGELSHRGCFRRVPDARRWRREAHAADDDRRRLRQRRRGQVRSRAVHAARLPTSCRSTATSTGISRTTIPTRRSRRTSPT